MITEKIIELTVRAIEYLYGGTADPSLIKVEVTKKEIPGDFTIVVFPFLKISRKSPEMTARDLGEYLREHMPAIASFEVVKGFLNLSMTDSFWLDFIGRNCNDNLFGFKAAAAGPPVVVEFSSPNTNKPLHLGHIRNNLLGSSVSEILRANGHPVVKVNLVNDRGIHICKSMLAYRKWGDGETPGSANMKGDHLVGKYYVLFDQRYRAQVREMIEAGDDEEAAQRNAPLMEEAREMLRLWEAGDPATVDLWNTMNHWTYEGFDETYRRLGISFDKTYFESKTYLLGKEIVTDGVARGLLDKREDGSVWIDLRNDGLDEKLLLRSDGTSVYITQDLGTAHLRYADFTPSEMIYVVGNEQNYHFDVLKKVLAKLGYPYAGHIHHLSYGMVELPEGKMKSREGTVVDADDLLDEMYSTAETTTRELGKAGEFSDAEAIKLFDMIGLGALKYFILKVDPKKNMLFDPAESIDFNGNTGPFIQYTHARIRSLLARAAAQGYAGDGLQVTSEITLQEQEKEVITRLYQFPVILADAGRELSPAVIANYVYDLSKAFNQFYQEIPVLKETDTNVVQMRLAMAGLVSVVLRNCMSLLGIEVPERM